jgi:hypothetical protein
MDIHDVSEQEAFLVGHLLSLQLENEQGNTSESNKNVEVLQSFMRKLIGNISFEKEKSVPMYTFNFEKDKFSIQMHQEISDSLFKQVASGFLSRYGKSQTELTSLFPVTSDEIISEIEFDVDEQGEIINIRQKVANEYYYYPSFDTIDLILVTRDWFRDGLEIFLEDTQETTYVLAKAHNKLQAHLSLDVCDLYQLFSVVKKLVYQLGYVNLDDPEIKQNYKFLRKIVKNNEEQITEDKMLILEDTKVGGFTSNVLLVNDIFKSRFSEHLDAINYVNLLLQELVAEGKLRVEEDPTYPEKPMHFPNSKDEQLEQLAEELKASREFNPDFREKLRAQLLKIIGEVRNNEN